MTATSTLWPHPVETREGYKGIVWPVKSDNLEHIAAFFGGELTSTIGMDGESAYNGVEIDFPSFSRSYLVKDGDYLVWREESGLSLMSRYDYRLYLG